MGNMRFVTMGGGVYYRVDMHKRSCSCKEFDTLKIPCTHVVSAAVTSKMSAETLVAEEYSNDYWGMAYSGTINPVHGGQVGQAEEGGDDMKLLPPRTRRPPGRPRKCRILSAGEIRVRVNNRTCALKMFLAGMLSLTDTFVFRDLVCSSDVGLAQGAVG